MGEPMRAELGMGEIRQALAEYVARRYQAAGDFDAQVDIKIDAQPPHDMRAAVTLCRKRSEPISAPTTTATATSEERADD